MATQFPPPCIEKISLTPLNYFDPFLKIGGHPQGSSLNSLFHCFIHPSLIQPHTV